jgi:hypothetical protein
MREPATNAKDLGENRCYLGYWCLQSEATVLECPNDQAVFTSTTLRSLVPKGCTFGFDIIVTVGRALFIEGLSEQQITGDLKRRNVMISKREIGYLGRKFIVYLALAHRQSRQQLVSSMAKRGGYILHVDGTCEGDSPHLFCGMDGISSLVQDNVKLPSEKKDFHFLRGRAKDNRPFTQVRQFLQEVLSDEKLAAAAVAMKEKVEIFDRLREALHIAEPAGKNGLNDGGKETGRIGSGRK